MTKKKPADADTSTGLHPAAYTPGNIASQQPTDNQPNLVIRPHPRSNLYVMIGINDTPMVEVDRRKLMSRSHVQNRLFARIFPLLPNGYRRAHAIFKPRPPIDYSRKEWAAAVKRALAEGGVE